MPKNPDWTQDELILALDLFFRAHRNQLDARHPEVIQLSHLLNQLPIHDTNLRQADFRNPEGVSMKLGNFLALDPAYVGTGLKRGGKLDREIWREFALDGARLRLTAASISKSASWIAETSAAYDSRYDDDEFPEGKILTRLHQRRSVTAERRTTRKGKCFRKQAD